MRLPGEVAVTRLQQKMPFTEARPNAQLIGKVVCIRPVGGLPASLSHARFWENAATVSVRRLRVPSGGVNCLTVNSAPCGSRTSVLGPHAVRRADHRGAEPLRGGGAVVAVGRPLMDAGVDRSGQVVAISGNLQHRPGAQVKVGGPPAEQRGLSIRT